MRMWKTVLRTLPALAVRAAVLPAYGLGTPPLELGKFDKL